jgi:prefoldin subunit 5
VIPAPQPKPVAAPVVTNPQQFTQAVNGMSEDRAVELIKQLLSQSDALHKQSIEAVENSLKDLSENNKNLLSNINNLTEQLRALKSATPEQTESIFSRAKSFLENLRKNKPPVNERAIKEAEDLIKKLEAQTKTIKETEKSLKDSLKALSDAKAASTAPEKSKFIDFAKAGFVSGLLKLSAVGLLAIGVYNMVTADDSEESDVNAGASIYPSGEESGKVEDIFNDTSKQGLKSDPFATSESRANFSEKLKNMSPDKREKILGEVARRRGAVGSHTLSRPIRIGGERIETVFPSQAAASRSPLTPGRLQATEEYMYKLLENNGRKASNIKGRILADANSNDPQDIADYMFSTIANKGLFKGLGTMRAGRYGRGGAIDADSNKGFSGSRKERMTMKERRSLRDVAREEFDQNEEPSDQIMDSFASGYEEIMKKYSSDSEYSINNYEIMKKADKISKRYFKDAVKDLASDGFMSEYYAGFSKLYDSKVKKRKPDFKTLYGFQEETGADRIHEAHPEAIVVSDAIGRGGLVENASEASKAMQEVALSMPTGNYRARYAFIQNALKKASS